MDFNFTVEEKTANSNILGAETGFNCGIYSNDDDKFLTFSGPDAIYIPVNNLADVKNEITISFWQYGNPDVQPAKQSIFEAINAEGKRVLNVHLPWDNSVVNWDVGDGTSYEGIQKTLTTTQYEGRWNFWAFTKNKTTGSMKIYLNGTLLTSGTGKAKTIGDITTFAIGRGLTDLEPNILRFYDGKIDEFAIWSKELDATTIKNLMYNKIDNTHPNYASLKAFYNFNEADLYNATEYVSNQAIKMNGVPHRTLFYGNRIKNFNIIQKRPNVVFVRNLATYTTATEIKVDEYPKQIMQLDIYEQLIPTDKPVFKQTIYGYPTYWNNHVYDENATLIDSTLVTPYNTIHLEMLQFPTTDPTEEVVIQWELGRFITPYGNNLSLGDNGWMWIFDVTDYQHLLQGDEVHLQAGNFQELLDQKFIFIEGTPNRELLDIQRVWNENVDLKVFDTKITSKTMTIQENAKMFRFKSTVTGHGFGTGNNCGEFCENLHSLKINGTKHFSWQILQECGESPLFPQGGTWFYDRAGWCPGMKGTTYNWELGEFISETDQTVDLDYDIEYDPYGNYVMESYFVSYGDHNFNTDAELEKIIAPNTYEQNNRFNPICGRPIIEIKNNGKQEITEVVIKYGVRGKTTLEYKWNGSLKFLEQAIIYLPEIDYVEFEEVDKKFFDAEIISVNGQADEYELNNKLWSTFTTVPTYDGEFVISILTNKYPEQNYYKIYNAAGEVVLQRDAFNVSAVHNDKINLAPGCYDFVMYDSEGDGMYDWPSSSGNGYIKFMNAQQSTVYKELQRWFGSNIKHSFIVTGTNKIDPSKVELDFNISPNPAKDFIKINFNSEAENLNIQIHDITGKLIYTDIINNQITKIIDINSYKSGIYFISISNDKFTKTEKIIINN